MRRVLFGFRVGSYYFGFLFDFFFHLFFCLLFFVLKFFRGSYFFVLCVIFVSRKLHGGYQNTTHFLKRIEEDIGKKIHTQNALQVFVFLNESKRRFLRECDSIQVLKLIELNEFEFESDYLHIY